MISKKGLILISVLTILLVVGGLYATYAINVFEEEVTPEEYDMAFNFDLSGSVTREMIVETGKTKVFDIDITNPYSDTVQYGVAYSLVSPVTLPEGVTIAESSLSKNSAVGMIDANETLSISVIVVNESSSNVTLSFSVINGYKNGGDLIVEDGNTLITEGYAVVLLTPEQVLSNLNLLTSLKNDTLDFNKTSCSSGCDESTVGIYSATDDLGMSYYFRGDVDNNYVKFGKNKSGYDMYWRIIRINGDGTIRMIYEGTSPHANGTESKDIDNRVVDYIAYNSDYDTDNYDDNAYVGYMYGDVGVTDTGDTGYYKTHANTMNSTIKKYLEDVWYTDNFLGTVYEDYISDAIYCNDRSVVEGTGISHDDTTYSAMHRVNDYIESQLPILTCALQNDRFTMNNSKINPLDGKGTNQKLKYPVGLITADEVALAGSLYGQTNSLYYLNNGTWYWTMTPSDSFFNFISDVEYGDVRVYAVDDRYQGILGELPENAAGVRPVISLKADALKYDAATSNGTMEHPFVIAD